MKTFPLFVVAINLYVVRCQPISPCKLPVKPVPCNPTCCFDTIKCEDIDGRPPYLGADSVTPVYSSDNQADFRQLPALTSASLGWNNTFVGIHVSYRFYSVQFKMVSRYLQPQKDSMLGYWHPNPIGLDGLKPYRVLKDNCRNGYGSYTDWGTGCSTTDETVSNVVATLHYNKKYILVCDGFISEAGYMWNLPEFCPLSDGIPLSRGEGCINTEYKPLCHLEGLNLIDAFTLPDGKGGEIMVAYYGESQISNPGNYAREYTIYTWDGKNFQYQDKVDGELSAIDIFEIEKDSTGKPIAAYGLYFTDSGEVCPFKHVVGEKDYNFEHKASPINIPCRSLQTFIACPQAWCVDAFVDASFTVKDKEGKEQVYLLLYKNMWVVEPKPLPLDVPLVRDHILLDPSVNTTCKYRYPTDERKEYHENNGVFTCAISDALAAFVYTVNGEQYMFNHYGYLKQNNWHIVHKGRRYILQNRKAPDFFPGIFLAEAAWFDPIKNVLYLFKGSNFNMYRLEGTLNPNARNFGFTATPIQNGTTRDLGLIYDDEPENGIGAVVSMNGSNYFFNQRFRFMEIKDGETTVTGKPRFVQKHFFRVKSQCYYNDFDAWNDLLARNGEKTEEPLYTKPDSVAYLENRLSAVESSSLFIWIVLIIVTGTSIAVVGLIFMYKVGRRMGPIWATKIKKVYDDPIKKRAPFSQPKYLASNRVGPDSSAMSKDLKPSRDQKTSLRKVGKTQSTRHKTKSPT